MLIKACQRGDALAQEVIYKRYVVAMYNRINRMVIDRMQTEDLVQETFIKVFSKIDSFRGHSTLGTWIKKIAINTTLSYLRRQNYATKDLLPEDIPSESETEHVSYSTAEIHNAIKSLPLRARMVFNLVALEDLKHKEVADLLGISESTSKTQYRRAKILLKKKLQNGQV